MRPAHLLRLYPRAWRERYGDEFLAMLASSEWTIARQLDVARGAADAWLSRDVGHIVSATDGGSMLTKTLRCDGRAGVTPRDGLAGAAVMLALAWGVKAAGAPTLAFPVSFTASMPFWLMKGTPWKAQVAIIGTTLLLLTLIGR